MANVGSLVGCGGGGPEGVQEACIYGKSEDEIRKKKTRHVEMTLGEKGGIWAIHNEGGHK